MSADNLLEKIKKLREITGVGFKDCKQAIDETKGDIEKSIELLRKKGIAKASKRMGRTAAEGIICIHENDNKFSMIELNSETDFVAKNEKFINFATELSKLSFNKFGKMDDILNSKMENNKIVKITLSRSAFVGDDKSINFSYVHSSLKQNVGKLGVLLSIETTKPKNDILELGKQLAMHIAASSPLAIDRDGLDQNLIKKEKEIITEELKNSGKDPKIVEKIANGKLEKFISENTLLNQEWIMEPKKKVKDIMKKFAGNDKIEIKKYVRYKVGEVL